MRLLHLSQARLLRPTNVADKRTGGTRERSRASNLVGKRKLGVQEVRHAMFDQLKRFGVSALLGFAALAFTASRSQAQFYGNPFFQVRPGLTLGQAAFNISVLGQARQNVPGPFTSPFGLGGSG